MEKHTDAAVERNETAELYALQKEFFSTGSTCDPAFRRGLLSNLEKLLRENEAALLEAVCQDLGKTYSETYMTELAPLYAEIHLAQRRLTAWSSPRTVPTPIVLLPSVSKVYPHPLGVVLIFATWNYPVQLSLLPLVSALAAGDCAIIKLPDNCRRTTPLLYELIERYFDREYVAAVTDSFSAVRALHTCRFDLVFYTGGALVARIISKAAAEKLTPVVTELGGKSPVIVTADANLRLAAKRIVFGKLLSAGQTCVAPDYLFVDEKVKEELLWYMRMYTKKFYSEGCEDRGYPKIINKLHYDRLVSYLGDGKIVFGGGHDDAERKIEFTVMENIDPRSKLFREEIFGPILPVFSYKSLRGTVSFLRSRPAPLALYLFTGSTADRDYVLSSLPSGGGCVNDTMMHMMNPNLPFGGIGLSGSGRYHGRSGFDTMSSHTSMLISPRSLDLAGLRYPPHQGKVPLLRFLYKFM